MKRRTTSQATTMPLTMMIMREMASKGRQRRGRRQRQETEATQKQREQREHKQRWQSGRVNISAAYDNDDVEADADAHDEDDDGNDDDNDNVLGGTNTNNNINNREWHNQNSNNYNSSSTNYSISGLGQQKQELQQPKPTQHQEQPLYLPTKPHSFPWHLLLLLVALCTLTSAANDSTYATSQQLQQRLNANGTDYTLLDDETTTTLTTLAGTLATTSSAKNSVAIDIIEDEEDAEKASEYIFDRTDVRVIFITLYTIVFCCCFFGNLLVILVVTLSRRLRSITNFFLANLAFADFCVGLFCVMQNLSIYLIDSWVFGEFLCRMYQFVHSLSYTASIFILVVICMERYFAIVHPITCKQILTAARLRMVIVTVWITSAVYSTPKFVFSKTIKNIHTQDGQEEEICVLDREMFNSKLLDMINFVLLYVMPLLVMTVLYSKIAIALWRSSRGLTPHVMQQQQQQHQQQQQPAQDNSMGMHNSMYHHHHHHQHHHMHSLHHHHHQLPATTVVGGGGASAVASGVGGTGITTTTLASGSSSSTSLSRKQSSKYEKRGVSITESQVSLEADRPIVSACRKTSFYHHSHTHHQRPGNGGGGGSGVGMAGTTHMSHSSSNVLRARRGVVRMLIIFVLTFALCNLPYHARKMWQYWSRSYRGDSNFNALLTPLTFLVTYFNSGVNPLLYAFLSRNFRKGMKELLLCSWKKGKGKSSSNSSMHHKRKALQMATISFLYPHPMRNTLDPLAAHGHHTHWQRTAMMAKHLEDALQGLRSTLLNPIRELH
ncbi:trissin receptor isoform X2 [Drosophila tropicalis]|uniref:trissin receptor isoform X2 n=1 Tax=Drosophila tropicalis TaxID=46794 RepID=UPI0035AC0FB6